MKEVAICSYTMVISTPRLCNDASFLPPSENKANKIVCREILDEQGQTEFLKRKAEQQELVKLEEQKQKQLVLEAEAESEKKKTEGEGVGKITGLEDLLKLLQQDLHDEL